MRKKSFIFIFLFFSLLLHFLAGSFFSLKIEANAQPVIFNWANILSRKDLFFKGGKSDFPPGIDFSTGSFREKYLASFFIPPFGVSKKSDPEFYLPAFFEDSDPAGQGVSIREVTPYFYLWKNIAVFSSRPEETVSYRAYVSAYGKVIFLQPEKLPVDSGGNLQLQEYIRRAGYFPAGKFFWTKLNAVVK